MRLKMPAAHAPTWAEDSGRAVCPGGIWGAFRVEETLTHALTCHSPGASTNSSCNRR
jgi:hypothetical protein